jgi:hypothetical protein
MTSYRCLSHYETLRVDRGASPERVRTAYRRLAQKFHPDKHAAKRAAATDVMVLINQAYEVLADPAQRAAYDEWLAAEEERAASGGAVAAAVFVPDRFGWSGWLLWAITSIAVLTIGFVVIRTHLPLQAAPPRALPGAQAAPAAPVEAALPSRPVEPWTEPVRTALPANPETDPVARLVREGTLQNPRIPQPGNP